MPLNLKNLPKKSGPRQPNIDLGTYPARIVQIIDQGMQPQRAYQGMDKPPAHEVRLTYELVDVFMQDDEGNDVEDKPRWISEVIPLYSIDIDLAKSTKRYKAIDPGMEFGGDITQLIGQPCMVTIVHKESKGVTYDNVGNVSPMSPKQAAKCPELVNPPVLFVIDEPDMEVWEKLPSWMQDIVKGNLEYKGSALEAALRGSGGKGAGVAKGKPAKAAEEPADVDDNEENW